MNQDNNTGVFQLKIPKPNVGEPSITMAPLVDVVFLLLIFFVVTTVFPENRGIVIEKPQASDSSQVQSKKIQFMVTADEKVHYKNTEISAADISRLVRDFLGAEPEGVILLHVDRKVTTAKLIEVMDAGKAGGGQRLAIATDEKSGDKK